MSFTPDATSAVRPWQAVYPQVGIAPVLPAPEHQSLAHLIHDHCTRWARDSQAKAAFTCVVPNGMNGSLSFCAGGCLVGRVCRLPAWYFGFGPGRPCGGAVAQQPDLSGGGFWCAQGRVRAGQHQPALHRERNGAPVQQQPGQGLGGGRHVCRQVARGAGANRCEKHCAGRRARVFSGDSARHHPRRAKGLEQSAAASDGAPCATAGGAGPGPRHFGPAACPKLLARFAAARFGLASIHRGAPRA